MAHATDAAHDPHRPNVKLFAAVFGALMFFTLLTVLVSRFHLPRPQAIALGLAIALVKAGLVAAIFMHLWGEDKRIHRILCFVGCLAAMLLFPIVDFALLSSQLTDHAPVAAQRPNEAPEAPAPGGK